MYILGINAFHGDASATLIENGEVILAIEEERLNRIKHWAGFPYQSIHACLQQAGIGLKDLDHIAISTDPSANLKNKIIYSLSRVTRIHSMLRDKLSKVGNIRDLRSILSERFNVAEEEITAGIHNVEHHLAHMASSFYVSPYEEAAIMSLDGMGDFVSSKWGVGTGTDITTYGQVEYPHSLGYLYSAITQYLGFRDYGDEEKVMGLASYGDPAPWQDVFNDIIKLPVDDQSIGFKLNLDYFLHHKQGVKMQWKEGIPHVGLLYSDKLPQELGAPRKAEDPYDQRFCNIAASLQQRIEEVGLSMMQRLADQTGHHTLCLAGGVVLNSVMNGKIRDRTSFEKVYIHPNAGDGGTSLGSAYYVWHQLKNNKRQTVISHPYLGTSFDDAYIGRILKDREQARRVESEEELLEKTAHALAEGRVIGWFQGAMEWGPRALGARSILVDPRRADMKDVLNHRVKRRESFRPFAPSVLEEYVGEYFEQDWPSPVMLMVYKVREEMRQTIPAVTHIDGTGRLQTVSREHHQRYYDLIKYFFNITGVPVLLNTSFNENEPIVHTPEEALDCFDRTRMDLLVMGNYMLWKEAP